MLMIGTDSGVPMLFHSQSTWNELDILGEPLLGVPAMEAIRAATYWPAKFMEQEDNSGTIAVGNMQISSLSGAMC